MKIPTRVTPSVDPSKQGLAYLSSAGATPDAFGASIGQGITALAAGASKFLEEEERRKAKIEDFELQRRWTEHETDFYTKTVDEIKKTAPATGTGTRERTEEAFDTQFGAVMSTVPERLKGEYRLKMAQSRQRAVNDSFSFEKKSGEVFAKTGIDNETSKAKVATNLTPDQFFAERARVFELIDKSPLLEIEKEKLKREKEIELLSVRHKAQAKEGELSAQNMPVEGGVEVFVDRLFQKESGGNPNAKNPLSSATGLGQFTTRTWLEVLRAERPDLAKGQPDEMLLALRTDGKLSRELTIAYATMNAKNLQQAGFAPTPGNIYLAHFLGPTGAKQVLAARDATPIQQIVGTEAYNANKAVFDKAQTVGAVKAWASADFATNLPRVQATRGTDGYWQAPGISYDLNGKVRAEPVSKEYVEKIAPVLSALGVTAKITSAGQQPGQGVGSHRHDVDSTGHASTADFVLERNGKPVTPAEDPALYAKTLEELAAQGFTGIGHYSWGIHVGSGTRKVWGPDKTGATVDPRFQQAVQRGWARAADGKKDSLDTDLSYGPLPYEDRVALRADGMREAQAQLTETRQQAAAQNKAAINDLFVSLIDNRGGQADIDRLRQQGILTEANDILKAQKLLEGNAVEISLKDQTLKRLLAGDIFDPTSSEDKKGLNSLVGKEGKAAMASMDKRYVSDHVLPIVERSRDIPTEVVGTLMGMVRSVDQNRALYALDALTQLERADARAFADRVPADLQRDVAYYNSLRDYLPQDQLMRGVNLGNSQEERQARSILRKEAQELLQKKDGKVSGLDKIVTEVINENDEYFSSRPELSSQAWAAKGLQRDAEALWVTEYERSGNADAATEIVKKSMKNRWGVTELGGKKVLMELPPEKAGYKPLGGNMNWIDKQVRQELNLQPGEKFELLSDEQTSQEFASAQRNPESRGPSYRFAVQDAYGTYRETFDPKTNKPKRLYFKPDAAAIQAEIDFKQSRSDMLAAETAARELHMAQRQARRTGIPVPEDVVETNRRLIARGAEVEAKRKADNTVSGNSGRGTFSDIIGGAQSQYTVDPETGDILREGKY